MNILQRIEALCLQRNMSKYRLSQLTGISQSAFSKMSREQSTLSLETIQRICDAFGISMAQFFSENEDYPDLTPQQREILKSWGLLSENKRNYILLMIEKLKDL